MKAKEGACGSKNMDKIPAGVKVIPYKPAAK
jgi:hypothetical protein